MKMSTAISAAALAVACSSSPTPAADVPDPPSSLRGVNLAGADLGEHTWPESMIRTTRTDAR